MRRIAWLLGLLTLVGLSLPPILAYREKTRRHALGQDAFDPSADVLDLAVIFDGLEGASTAAAFRGGQVDCWYGGGTLDLRGATLDSAGGRLRLRSIFGGLDVIVPRGWRIALDSRGIFGGASDGTDPATADADGPTLAIQARSIFGGVSIRSAQAAD
jgi:hypothetical protein